MDRSSLRKVSTTSDHEKRLAFKTQLAQHLEARPEESNASLTQLSRSIPVGSAVWHPDLGLCTVFSVDERANSIVLNFPDRGKIEMALRQVEMNLLPVGPDGEPTHLRGQAPPVLAPSPVEGLQTFSPTNWGRTTPEALAETEKQLASETLPSSSVGSTPMANGVPVGGAVWHPDLGPCTVVSVDRKTNNIVLESASLGRIDLVLSQVESRLVPPNKDGGPAYVDKFSPPFVEPTLIDASEAFSPTNWHRADQPTIYTERKNDPKKATRKPVPGHLPVGSSVWHPDLGACTVSSIDVKANTILLDFATFGGLDMILSQVEPKLLPIYSNAPSHVAKAPTTRTAKPNTLKGETLQRTVVLPPVLQGWKPLEQFSYLTREKHFTTEEANECIAVLSGRFNITPAFDIRWDGVLDQGKKAIFKQNLSARVSHEPVIEPVVPVVDTTPQPLSEVLSLSVTLPSIFKTLSVSGQYVFLTKTKHLTPEEANDVIAVHSDAAPQKSKIQFEILWDDQVGASAFGVRRVLKEPDAQTKVAAPTMVRAVLDLPVVFKTWKPVEQYQYLTSTKHLSSLAANNVIEAVLYNFPCDFNLVWGELPDTEKRAAYKESLLKKVEANGLKKAITPAPAVDTTPQPLSEVLSLSVTLPEIFKSLQATGQYVFLTKTKHLTPEEANDVIAVYRDTVPRNRNVRFEILWDDRVGISEFGVGRVLKEPEVKAEVPMVRKVLDLPAVFRTWKPVEQYQYLTSNKHLTSVTANNVIEAILYQSPCEFDVVWEELAEADKRSAYKDSLLKKVEARSTVKAAPVRAALPAAMTHVGVHRTTVDTEVTKKVVVPGAQRLSVSVPHEFKTWNASDQYTFFTKTKKLTPNEANDLISVYNGALPHDAKMQYELTWDTLAVGLDPSQVRRSRDGIETEVRETVSELQKLSVTLPQVYKNWRSADQFSFLVHTKRLSNEEANDIMAIHSGKTVQGTKTEYEIIWDER